VKKILIVEDEPSIQEILSEFVSMLGFEPVIAIDGQMGLAKFSSEGPFVLYLLDIKIPKLNGYELARRIREKDRERPIIFLTGLVNAETREKIAAIPYAYYVKKPITFAEFKNILSKAGII